MKICTYQKYLLPCLQQELSQEKSDDVRKHLSICDQCAVEWKRLSMVHTMLTNRERTAVPQNLYNDYIASLHRRFAPVPLWRIAFEKAVDGVRQFFSSPMPAYRLSRAFVILLAGIFIGRSIFVVNKLQHDIPVQPVSMSAELSGQDLQFLNAYLVRSEVLLLTIANTPLDSLRKDDVHINRELAQALLFQSQQAQRKVSLLEDDALVSFMNHLEFVLLEVSNRSDDEIQTTFRDLKDMIKDARMVQASRQGQSRLQQSLLQGV
jgi:hypothetical protein